MKRLRKSWKGLGSQETLEGVQEQLEEEQSAQPKSKGRKLSAMQAGSLAIVISQETWTRQRKYDIQREDSPLCLVCQGTEEEAADTILHRKFDCQGIKAFEGYKNFEWIRDLVQGYRQGPCSDRWKLWINTALRHSPGVPNLGWIQGTKLSYCRDWGCKILGILMVQHMRVSGGIWLGLGGQWY